MESQFAYIVVDTEDMSVPLAICSSREKAVEMAEKVIKDDWGGVRHLSDDVETSKFIIHQVAMDSLIEEEEYLYKDVWDSLCALTVN